MLNNVLVIFGGVLLFFVKKSSSVTLLCLGRTIVGFNAGKNSFRYYAMARKIVSVILKGDIELIKFLIYSSFVQIYQSWTNKECYDFN